MQIKTIALIGAGAIGAYFISCLTEKFQDNFWIIAEGERKARLEAEGIVINDQQYKLNVKTPAEAQGADLVIVGVKYGALASVLPMLEKIVAEHTLVISPMNGVDSEAVIGAHIGAAHLLPSFMFIASQRVGNSIKFNPAKTLGLTFGEEDGKPSAKTEALSAALDGTSFRYRVSDNINKAIWNKYALNISKNLPQAIINCGLGAYTDSEHLAYISQRLHDEVALVAAAKGIIVDPPKASKASPDARYSTLQDLDAKRETEIEMFSGALIKMAKELKLEVPFNEFAYHAIKCLEEKNSGKIR